MARDIRIDTLKGFLIILVIMGHCITTLDNINVLNHAVMGLIYIFHMPLFILISGYLTKSPEQQSASKMWQGCLKIFVPMVIFHIISCTRSWLYGGDFYQHFIMFPYGILWYLICLIYWRIVLFYTPRWLWNRPVLYLSIALLISVLSGLTHLGSTLASQRGLNFYVFFLLGYYYRQGAISQRWWKNNILHAAVAIVLLPLIFWLFPRCGNVMNGAEYYSLQDIPQKVMILACSVAMSLLVFNLMRANRFLAHIGKDSLFYYLYHFYIIYIVIVWWVKLTYWPDTMPFIILYTAAVVAILLLMHKVRFFRWLANPLAEWKPKKTQEK